MSQLHQRLAHPLPRKLALLVLLVGGMAALLSGGPWSPRDLLPAARLGGSGYWLAGAEGGVYAFGDAPDFGGLSTPSAPVATMTGTSSGKGYWLTTRTGEVFAFGDAVAHGGLGGIKLNEPIVGMAPTPTGDGYWLVASDGGVFSFGDARFFGSMGGQPLNKPIVGMTPTASGQGYWFVASDGGLFAFGDAGFFGSMGDTVLNKPVVGMAASRTGRGYRLVAADGGIFSFGDAAFYGSTGDKVLNKPIRSMAATPSGDGYWFVASDGGVFSFGDAVFSGSAAGKGQAIVGMAAANALPRAAGDSFTTDEDVAATIDVLANDKNLSDTPIRLALESGPSMGTASVENGRVVYRPASDANGADALTYRVTDADGDAATGRVSITVRPVNDAPGISTFGTAGGGSSSLDIDEDSQGGVGFSVHDRETAAGSLTATASSNNQQLLPNANITVTGSGDERTMTFRPAANQNGTAIITVTVSDGQASSGRTFTVNVRPVNDFPTMASFPSSKTIDEDADTGGLDFSVGDSETAASALDVTATSDNGSLVGSSGLVVTKGSGGHRILTVTPGPNASGTARITVTVSDGELTASRSFTLIVNPVNDPPVADDVPISTDEDEAVSGTVAATDVDNTTLTFSVAAGGAPTHGALSLAANGTYSYTPAENYNGPDSFTVKVDDGQGGSATAVVTVDVTPVNDAPVATDAHVTIDEDQDAAGYLNSSPYFSITDVDDYSVFCALKAGEDPSHGVAGMVPNCFFSYHPDAGWSGSDQFTVVVSDSAGASDEMTVFVTVKNVNDTPVVTGTDLTATEDGATVNGSVSATDEEGTPVTFALGAIHPTKGEATVDPDGTVHYTPGPDENGADSFTVTASDGNSVGTATVTVAIEAVNDDPVTADVLLSTDEDTPGSVTVAGTDVDGDTLSFAVQSPPAMGSVVLDASTGVADYTPDAEQYGTDSFTVFIDDGRGGNALSTVTVTINSVNDNPVAVGTHLSVTEDGAAVTGSATATDIDGDAVTFGLGATLPAKGTATVDSDGTVRYTPAPDQNGADTFTVDASDGNGGADTVAVTVDIAPVNDTPDAVGDVVDTEEDVPVTIPVLANDTGTGDRPVTVTMTTGPTSGTTGVNADGTIVYTPLADWSGTAGFDYTATDVDGEASSAHVTVNVGAVNDAPVADPGAVVTNEDTLEGGQLTASDVENSPLTYSVVTEPAHGEASVASNGFFTYTPDADWHGTDSFTFKVNDGGKDSAPATVTVTVNAVNDTPVAVLDTATTNEDTAVVIPILDNDSGLGDGIALLEIASGPSPASAGGAAFNADGTVTFTPAPNWNGIASFTYRVTDADGQKSSTTVSVTVAAVNDDPTLGSIPNVATTEDTASSPIALTVGDVDTSTALLTLSGTASPDVVEEFSFSGSGANRTLVITPKLNASGTATVTITVSDGSGGTASRTFTLTVNAVNDAPTAPAQSFTATEDAPYSGTLTGSDIENDPITFALATPAGHGAVTVDSDGTFDYTPSPDFTGTDTFTFTVSDGTATSAPVTATITVTNVNDAPVAENDTVDLGFLGSASFNILDNDADADNDSLTVIIKTQPAHGVLACTNGQCTIAGGVAGDTFTYELKDPSGAASAIATVTFQ
jgi:large repetitive protein